MVDLQGHVRLKFKSGNESESRISLKWIRLPSGLAKRFMLRSALTGRQGMCHRGCVGRSFAIVPDCPFGLEKVVRKGSDLMRLAQKMIVGGLLLDRVANSHLHHLGFRFVSGTPTARSESSFTALPSPSRAICLVPALRPSSRPKRIEHHVSPDNFYWRRSTAKLASGRVVR
jgi:hypothetical protein